jgi:sugar/nucleoside kinase (ribokinase family)
LSSPDLDLIVLGDCNPDLIVAGADVTPVFGQAEKLVDSMTLMIGGSAAITAVAAARLGLSVALVASVGDDAAGELMLSMLAAENVGTSSVLIRPGQPTGFTTVLSAGADRAILTALGAMTRLRAGDVRAPLLARARHLHVSSYFLLEDTLGDGLASLFAGARAAGVTTSLDTNYDPAGRWGDERLRAAIAEADVFLPNEAEAIGISGQAEAGDAAEWLADLGRAVVIKLGERGALVGGPEPGRRSRVALPPVEPVDTTGAGDCFNAGVIAGLLDGLDLPHAAGVGCAAGSLSTAAPGGTGAVVDRKAAFALANTARHHDLGRSFAHSDEDRPRS